MTINKKLIHQICFNFILFSLCNCSIYSAGISTSDFDTSIVVSEGNFMLNNVYLSSFVFCKKNFCKFGNLIEVYSYCMENDEFSFKDEYSFKPDWILFWLTSSSVKELKFYIFTKVLNPSEVIFISQTYRIFNLWIFDKKNNPLSWILLWLMDNSVNLGKN